MKSIKHKLSSFSQEIKTGSFSRAEAAQAISLGVRHIHSSPLGDKDPLVQITSAKLLGGRQSYPWEHFTQAKQFTLLHNEAQENLNLQIAEGSKLFRGASNRHRLELVLGEITTNFFYHSFKNMNGSDKYDRTHKVVLQETEQIDFQYFESAHGFFISFNDNSGTLTFEDVRLRLLNGYSQTKHSTFDNKHQGAGLGLYLIFETVTHLAITIDPGKRTQLSVWLAPTRHFQADLFSFNFFEVKKV